MEKPQIISEIEKRVLRKKNDYTLWTIGITDTPKSRKDQHIDNGKDVSEWADWSIHSESDAREIEEHFLDKGMRGDTEGGSVKYVYIF
jgi:hypothetical protein